MTMRMPARWQRPTAAATSGRGGSIIATRPRKVRSRSTSSALQAALPSGQLGAWPRRAPAGPRGRSSSFAPSAAARSGRPGAAPGRRSGRRRSGPEPRSGRPWCRQLRGPAPLGRIGAIHMVARRRGSCSSACGATRRGSRGCAAPRPPPRPGPARPCAPPPAGRPRSGRPGSTMPPARRGRRPPRRDQPGVVAERAGPQQGAQVIVGCRAPCCARISPRGRVAAAAHRVLAPASPELAHRHLVLGQRAGLVGADHGACSRASRPPTGA